MTCVPLTRAGTIAPIVDFLKRVGVRLDPVFAMAGLPPWIMADRDALIPGTSPARLLGVALRHADIPNLGLTAGERADIGRLGTFGRLIRSAPTLGAALESAVRDSSTMTSNRPLDLRPRGEYVDFCMTIGDRVDPRDVAWQQDNQFSLGLMIAVVRLATGPSWRPAEVRLQTDESAGLRDAQSLAGVPVAVRQPMTMISIPRALLPMRLPAVSPTDVPSNVESWRSSAPAHDFGGSIRQAVETLSRGERFPSVRQTADFIGMSVRTLQRRLAESGESHEALVVQTRLATAGAVLEQTNGRILDLALDLGYSDHANFTRAFRRWVGCSPLEYRARHRRQHAANHCGAGAADEPHRAAAFGRRERLGDGRRIATRRACAPGSELDPSVRF
jgi:AraC-like DNA-binding protein